jgi:chromosome segregation ATPase
VSTITATDLIEELTKLKAQNEELRHGNQALVKEKRTLVQELGRANRDRQAADDLAASLEPLKAQLLQQERETQVAREALGGLRERAENAEKAAAETQKSRDAQKGENDLLHNHLSLAQNRLADAAGELERCRADAKKLEPYRDAIMSLKQVL